MGAVGVTGTGAANALAEEADLVLARRHAPAGFHHRLLGAVQERRATRSSASTRRPSMPASTAPCPLVADAKVGLERLAAGARRLDRAGGLDARRRKDGKADWLKAAAALHRPDQCGPALRRAGDRRGAARRASAATSSSAPPAACRASCTSSGRPARPAATTSNTAIPAWATRSPAASASRWREPDARGRSSWSATAPT